jgi:hypothetical protein
VRRFQRGQALVEFALTSVILLVFVLGVIDLSFLFTTRAEVLQGLRDATRYAAANPDSWDNSSHPQSDSIQGHLVLPNVTVANDDTHIVISYWLVGSTLNKCGHYTVGSGHGHDSQGGFVADNGHQDDGSDCLLPGTLIQIQATYTYTYITPLLKGTFHSTTIVATASAMEECPQGGCNSGNDGDGGGGEGG